MRRYSDYKEAKDKIRFYYENTMAGRISLLTKAKSSKYLPKLGGIYLTMMRSKIRFDSVALSI